jgi:hypothetical protein
MNTMDSNDMSRSKYPLAMVEALLNAFGAGLGGGYDVGCKLEELLAKSPLGSRARELSYTSLIGIFHGRGHSRKCQVKNFARYVLGLGLEPLEEAEEFFSRSNALAGSTRYSSRFHRQQDIVLYLQHIDRVERAAGLSLLISLRIFLKLIMGRQASLLQVQRSDQGSKDDSRTQEIDEEAQHCGHLCA